jgi:O-antigen/teichoic acid export membrane protein
MYYMYQVERQRGALGLGEVATRRPSPRHEIDRLQRSLSMQIIVALFVCIGLLIVASTLFIDNN